LRSKTQAALPQQKRFLFPFVFMVLRFGEKRLYLRNNLLAFLAASHNKYTRLNGRAARRRVSGNTVAQGKREREKEGNLLAAWRTLRHKKPRRRSPDAATREYTYRSTPRLPSSKRGERVKPVPSLLLLSQGPDARSASARAAPSLAPSGGRRLCLGSCALIAAVAPQSDPLPGGGGRSLAKKIAYEIKS
jgi:hypothetical protein